MTAEPTLSNQNDPSDIKPEKEGFSSWKSSSPLALAALAFGLAVLSDILFHGHIAGISLLFFALFSVLVILAAGKLEKRELQVTDLVLAVLIVLFAGLSVIRLEPMTRTLSILAVLALLSLWIWSFSSRQLFLSGILDFTLAWLAPAIYWIFPWGVISQAWKKFGGERQSRSLLRSILLGLLLALPILLVFIILFSAADLVFQAQVVKLAEWLRLEALKDVFAHMTWIVMAFIVFIGALVMALQLGQKRSLVNEGKPLLPPFLGSIEITVVLASVSMLFAVFVGIQFTYLFGAANISPAGYTYAEYARRGFFELVAVSILALLLIQTLRSYRKSDGRSPSILFNILCTLLVVLVLIILASALKRMMLYEDAYGLTRLRAYTLVGLGWIAALLAAFLGLLWSKRQVRFAQLLAAVALGFTATLGILNVDAFIVQRNLQRHMAGEELDVWYMLTLTDDAVPLIVDHALENPDITDERILADMACRRERITGEKYQEWQAYHFSRAAAETAVESIADALAAFPISVDEYGYKSVEWSGGEWGCSSWLD